LAPASRLCCPSAAAAAAAAGEPAAAADGDEDDDEEEEDVEEEWQPEDSGPDSEDEEGGEEGSGRSARHLTKSSRYSLQEHHGPAIHRVTGGHPAAVFGGGRRAGIGCLGWVS